MPKTKKSSREKHPLYPSFRKFISGADFTKAPGTTDVEFYLSAWWECFLAGADAESRHYASRANNEPMEA